MWQDELGLGAARNAVERYLPPKYRARTCRYYVYGAEYNLLAASAVAQATSFTVDGGVDFLCLAVSEIITTDATGATEQAFPEHTVAIQNEASGEAWHAGFQHAANIFGRSPVLGRPTPLLWPKLVPAKGQITIRANNLEANTRRIWMSFYGVQVLDL